MTAEEKVKKFINEIFEPVEDKPGYVWFNKRNFQIISIELLQKKLCESLEIIDNYNIMKERMNRNDTI